MPSELAVGIIGVNTTGGWAAEAHVPAIQQLEGMRLVAVATSRQEAADEAARQFGVGKAFGDGLALIADPAIDVVTVATRVPDHRALLLAAARAGKHVYSEWPLGAGSAESAAIAAAVGAAGVKNAIGLQLRGSPAVAQARALLEEGAIGRVLSASVLSTTAGFGPDVPPQFAYLEDPATFANMVTIQGAHTLDLVVALLGGIGSMSVLGSQQFPTVQMGEPRRPHQRVTFDHLLLQGRMMSGVPFTVEVAGGRSGATPFRLDIVGERGALRLDGGAKRGVQSSRIGLLRDGERQTVEAGALAGLPDSALNVAGVYAALRDDIRQGTATVTDFGHAVRHSHLIEDLLAASGQGVRRNPGSWPG